MDINFINSLLDHRKNLDKIIKEAKIELARKNTGFSYCTCESFIQNGSNSVCFNESLTSLVFPQSLQIICTNDNSRHNKKELISANDIVPFLSHCNNHGIRVKIDQNPSYRTVWVELVCRYIEMNPAELATYKEKLNESMVAGEFRGPLK